MEFQTIACQGHLVLPKQFQKQWEGKRVNVILHESPKNEEEPSEKNLLLSALRKIKITAPDDFSENIDAYLNGEKNA